MNVNRYIVRPSGMDDYTTTWLHEFLIWFLLSCSDYYKQYQKLIDYVGKPSIFE